MGKTLDWSPEAVAFRFWSNVNLLGACWLWEGSTIGKGYGLFYADTRTNVVADRWAYEYLKGPIPEGMELDHLCKVKNCVNPDHLEPVSHQENTRRAYADKPKKTHCLRGHEYTEVGRTWNGRGCRKCASLSERVRQQAKRESAKAKSLSLILEG